MIRNLRKTEVFVALGANLPSALGGPEHTLAAAVDRLKNFQLQNLAVSRFFRTPCFPPGAGPDYVNAALRAEVTCTAADLLQTLHQIEAEFGRERIQRWGQRSLDLDLLAFGDDVLPDLATYTTWKDLAPEAQRQETPTQMILPHPRFQDRAFVLVPMKDIAAEWQHPVLGRSVDQMLADLDPTELDEVVPI